LQDLDNAIEADQDRHVRHDGVEVEQAEAPFDKDQEEIFAEILERMKAAEIIPDNFGVTPPEWEEPNYGELETIKIARKSVEIQLPFDVWYPRAVLWAQGLTIMKKIQAESYR
ncbi:hypothetical protein GGX14DRAFT_372637, partial [Mycena pura]